jgi:hypothetical protein
MFAELIGKLTNGFLAKTITGDGTWLPAVSEIMSALKGRRFQDIEDIQKNVTTALKVVSMQVCLK